MLPLPEHGRRYGASRKVRLADTHMSGRLRLDALARYLQDVANDDAVDSGLEGAMAWVVRRVAVEIHHPPVLNDVVELVTFCSGFGSRFAERRTVVTVDGRLAVDAAALWVSVDPTSGRPARLGEQFHAIYGEAAGGRVVTSRLSHHTPPESATRRRWHQRTTDFDVLGHVNNSVAFAAVEEAIGGTAVSAVEVEYRNAIEPGDEVELVTTADSMWLTASGQVRVSACFQCR